MSVQKQDYFSTVYQISIKYQNLLLSCLKDQRPAISKNDLIVINSVFSDILNYINEATETVDKNCNEKTREDYLGKSVDLIDVGISLTDNLYKILVAMGVNTEYLENKYRRLTEERNGEKGVYPLNVKIVFLETFYTLNFKYLKNYLKSLQILNELPFDAIKINSSFLSGYDNSSKSKIMMKNVLNMAKELGINTMMGSVEDEETLDFLKRAGCEKTQGHLYSEAAPFGQVTNPAFA